ncbi:Leucine-rich repeat receptor-like tyrosine-protein kinase [Dendrobium catenatum]|uniref:Leucine-rich repeat receptor-like tyrosine-protein kinase n=1 Tax=Dendrobium catenatum TaxID=906689 RepID=A0A2I0W2C7_9ASPA|nr:Leucine-rich repeat receptor-like tyrosine-protein kinase [Dendrobium catenatum]
MGTHAVGPSLESKSSVLSSSLCSQACFLRLGPLRHETYHRSQKTEQFTVRVFASNPKFRISLRLLLFSFYGSFVTVFFGSKPRVIDNGNLLLLYSWGLSLMKSLKEGNINTKGREGKEEVLRGWEWRSDQKSTMLELAKGIPSSKWNTSNSNPCEWKGVSCSSSRVTGLVLSGFGLSTSFSPRFFELLCDLSSLQSLDLSSNSFSIIPTSFFSCKGLSRLKYLNLSCNGLTGRLSNFSEFSALETLDLSFNNLKGVVGLNLNGLAQLKSLNLSSNLFNDNIPALKAMNQNSLTGSIPGDIGNLLKLQKLLLSSNELEGSLPVSLSKIKVLSRFAANQNKFNGAIPPGITSYVQIFDLSYNNLNGTIPPDLLAPASLQIVDLSANVLQGPIPSNFSKNLYRLRLGKNLLNGSIPSELGQLLNLTYLELNDNQLEGQIPQQLGNCKSLALLNLAKNFLHGGLPVSLGRLNQLVIVQLKQNILTGKIPAEFSNLANLSTLDLSQNSLTGAIPPAISSLSKLQVLNLENNNLNGSIPASLSSLPNIIELLLGNNKLSGIVPNMPTSLSLALNLTGNNLNGSIPSQLGEATQLEILDLSNNSFTGSVPNSFIALKSLTELVLSNNRLLSGLLPPLNPKTIVSFAGTGILNKSASAQGNVHRKRKSSTVLIVIVVIVGIFAGFLLIAAIFGLIMSKRMYRVEDEVHQSGDNALPQICNGHFITSNSNHKTGLDFFKAMELVGNPSNTMLKTRFSTYYKAAMPNGRNYTVKKLNWSEKILQMGSHEKFEHELEVLGRLSNSNIMVPLAYVLTEDSAYFFYEHIHKGTLFDFLHVGSETALDWPSRYSIALGVAQGLTFLHSCNQPVLLLDLSTKTIHLKSMKEPQIGDIELCKVIDPSNSTGNLSTVAGSVGYIPPGKVTHLFFLLECIAVNNII